MSVPLSLLAAHFIGDFLLQTNWMALNKSKSVEALTLHVCVYTSVFAGYLVRPFGLTQQLSAFLIFTWLSHWATDLVTSRITSRLWFIDLQSHRDPTWNAEGSMTFRLEYPYAAKVDMRKRHWFFVMIGLDQLIHFVTLSYAAQHWLKP